MRWVKPAGNIKESKVFQEAGEAGEREKGIQDPRGGGETDAVREAESMAFKDFEGEVILGRGGNPCRVGVGKDRAEKGLVGTENDRRV